MSKKTVKSLVLSLALVVCVLIQTISASAAYGTVATNGNKKISITIKVVDKANKVVEGAEVTLKAHDFNLFAKTRDLSLTAVTDASGIATFKISSTYDRVRGYSVSKEGYTHGWNLLKMDDGNWYAVDVTWDEPVGKTEVYYNYFNQTDEYLEEEKHNWDKDQYPKATGGKYKYQQDER